MVATSRAVIGKTLGELAEDPRARGVYLQSLQRGPELMPHEWWTVVERGDLLRIVGAPDDVERAGALIGFVERDLAKTDLTFLAGGICLGILLGLVKLDAAGIVLGLGTAGSILVVGLVGGWVRSWYPVFGAIPEPAQRLLMDIGLIVFIALVGLHAGPHAVEAYQTSGGAYFARIFLAGVLVTTLPLAVGAIVARTRAEDEPADGAGRPGRRADLHAGPDRAAGGQRQQRRIAGLHRAVRHRQHPAHRLGARGRGHRARDQKLATEGHDPMP